MRTDFDRVTVTKHGTVALLTLNHPEVMNAVSAKMIAGASEALDFVSSPANGFRALVVTGEGRAFCSGANLAEGPAEGAADIPTAIGQRLDTLYHPLLRKLRDVPLPIIMAVNGAAAGIGMSIALMGDLIVAGRSAYFVQAFARIGLVPDGGSTWLLPRLIGLARARELSLLAEKLPAEKALEWGLVNRVFDDVSLLDESLQLAAKLAQGPTVALAAMRRMYWESPHNTYEQQLEVERRSQQAAGGTEDFVEGVGAFLQKRPPSFKGK
ncbi:MAG: enoyl-CoA hydratase/isomerase [Alphaproteobacteria bacterium]|nr:enoyl-CoA hydratase/isomerase [Alphaproteobacteria bacterium]